MPVLQWFLIHRQQFGKLVGFVVDAICFSVPSLACAKNDYIYISAQKFNIIIFFKKYFLLINCLCERVVLETCNTRNTASLW